MTKPIGILGGTFDPVHFGHIGLAKDVYQICELAEVRLIPLHTPFHRQVPSASPEQRLQMLCLAIKEEEGLVVDERELQRGDVSFTVDTLRSFREEIGQQALCLIMGVDAFQSLNSWHQWTSIIEYAHIIVARRPGTEKKIASSELSELYKNNVTTVFSDLHAQQSGKILDVDIIEHDVSSTRIREIISKKQDVQSLLPDEVISYIKKEDLYHRY